MEKLTSWSERWCLMSRCPKLTSLIVAANLIYRKTARNFNPNVAMAGKISIVEVEQIVENGELDPDHIHLPGIYVNRIVLNPNPEKRIEKRTVRPSK